MKGFVIYYTEQDLIAQRLSACPEEASSPDLQHNALAGMFELRSISQYGRVFIDSDCFYALWRRV